ncbi:MAG: HAMP domain-containing sensor histidine kinase, partial [Phycisphaerae bacterium]
KDVSEIYGLRPGEAVKCAYACENPGGCGTSKHCAACGAVNAILDAQLGNISVQQCSVVREQGNDGLELLVRASPLAIGSYNFVICAINDISDHKRRRILERIFFHDILNTASGLKMLCRDEIADQKIASIKKAANHLIEEIKAQRDLAVAEHGELEVDPEHLQTRVLLDDVRETFKEFADFYKVTVAIAPRTKNCRLFADRTVLSRVLTNMVKNAVEASSSGQIVTIGCVNDGQYVKFWVHNHKVIPERDQLRIFHRSFSTKGPGRGLGTHSMKLLTERYLKGQVNFTSCKEDGTRFCVLVPVLQNA